jgi:hypothetical protein
MLQAVGNQKRFVLHKYIVFMSQIETNFDLKSNTEYSQSLILLMNKKVNFCEWNKLLFCSAGERIMKNPYPFYY